MVLPTLGSRTAKEQNNMTYTVHKLSILSDLFNCIFNASIVKYTVY